MAWHWSDLRSGLLASLFQFPILLIGAGFMVGPYTLVVNGLYQWFGWRRWRNGWLLVPAGLVILTALMLVASGRPTALHQLQMVTGAGCPKAPSELRHDMRGGGLVDLDLQFVFRCSSEETQALIRELELVIDPNPSLYPQRMPAGWPDYRTWPGVKRYELNDVEQNRYIELITDDAHEQVYLNLFSI